MRSKSLGARASVEKVKRGGVAASKFRVEVETGAGHRHLPQILEMIAGRGFAHGRSEMPRLCFRGWARRRLGSTGSRSKRFTFTKWGRWIRSPISWGLAWRWLLGNRRGALFRDQRRQRNGEDGARDAAGARSGDGGAARGQADVCARA